MRAAALLLIEPPKPAPTPQQREAVRQWATLNIVSVLAVLIIGGFALVLLARYRRAYLDRRLARRKIKPSPDAWSESAKRLRTGHAGADDDTVDIDPTDLHPDDVDDGPDPGSEGKGGGWRQ